MRLLLGALLLTHTSCDRPTAKAEAPPSPCREERFDGSRFTVCDPKGGELVLVAAGKGEPPARSFAEVGGTIDANRVAFAMNAGMFDEDGRPIGLAIVDGREVRALNRREGGGNFHLMPNGVFQVTRDGNAAVIATTAWKLNPNIRFASQSGPMLVIGGKLHPKLGHDGTSRLIRNGVGTHKGKALFVISEDGVSLGKFARFFRDQLKTPDALYFDGSVSSLWDPANGRQDSLTPLGPIIIALKPAASAPGRGSPATP
ncbi:phosphodiester glycosidase family protein [Sphingomonas lutea]|uniref:Phosphodiester glycosidase family protein n=1 Tax=Sphingomonas lutea TaxID=1045317 RepID=A0A7G9SG74_9SPHN|nr:phosphodiester glycosidase family protein [Sphingomonas lutea]QNN66849.1 phosphodiester glycosidase family protein [Sphingomonas lutea]